MMPPNGHEVELEELVNGLGRHLRTSWRRGVPLVLTIGGKPQMLVETLEDLEVVQEVILPSTRGGTASAGEASGRRRGA